MASAVASDPLTQQVVNSGVPAKPETLQFAEFLSNNASQTADRFQKQCFDYSGTSGGPLDSFASGIKGMVKKVQSFLNQMEEYSTPKGIARLDKMVEDFGETAKDNVLGVVNKRVDSLLDKTWPAADGASGLLTISVDAGDSDSPDAGSVAHKLEAAEEKFTDSLAKVTTLLTNLQAMLPDVIKTLKNARKEVSAVSKKLHSTFSTFKSNGPETFLMISKVYSTAWTAYYILFATMTTCVLFYGCWASGICGSRADVEYEGPKTTWDRMCCCCRACTACLRGCHDSHLCFWSVIILLEVIALLLFIIAILLCVLAGVKAFISSGCAQIYILGDDSICTGSLGQVQNFLKTFPHSESRCNNSTLLTCMLIGEKMKKSVIHTTLGSIMAAVFSFQMIIESAVLHERARWVKYFDEKSANERPASQD